MRGAHLTCDTSTSFLPMVKNASLMHCAHEMCAQRLSVVRIKGISSRLSLQNTHTGLTRDCELHRSQFHWRDCDSVIKSSGWL